MMSETTATAVGWPPAPCPPKTVSPPNLPVAITRFWLPCTRARGEVSARRDPQILADLIVGALVVSIVNWTIDKTYSLETGLHDSAAALGELLTSDPPSS